MINAANVVTVARVGLGLVTLSLLFVAGENYLWTAFGLTIFVMWADGIDGYLARKLNQSSKLGGILDIAGDRCVEMAYWIVFAVLNWIPVWVPLLFLVRGTFVDAIRTEAASEKGLTAFGAKTMMQSPVGKFIVASNFSRFTYAVVKALAFCFMIMGHTQLCSQTAIPLVAIGLVYGSAAFCVVRGLPVLLEGENIFLVQKKD